MVISKDDNKVLLPTDSENTHGYWFGFETDTQRITPVFKAQS